QQISGLVMAAHVLSGRAIAFRKAQVPDRAEACGTKGGDETVSVRPAVKRNAKTVWFQDAVHLGESRLQPSVIVVTRHRAAIARLVAGEIRRVGEDEIRAAHWKRRKDIQTIAVNNG